MKKSSKHARLDVIRENSIRIHIQRQRKKVFIMSTNWNFQRFETLHTNSSPNVHTAHHWCTHTFTPSRMLWLHGKFHTAISFHFISVHTADECAKQRRKQSTTSKSKDGCLLRLSMSIWLRILLIWFEEHCEEKMISLTRNDYSSILGRARIKFLTRDVHKYAE